MSNQLQSYAIEEVANVINNRTDATVIEAHPEHNNVDVIGKVGAEVFAPLAEEGVYVTAALPKGNQKIRLWFGELNK